MRVAVVGCGYVGLVSAACFSDFGHTVVCIDTDTSRIEGLKQGKIPIYEPGLDALVAHNVAEGRLSFTTDLKEAVQGAAAVFIAVGTPSRRGDGHADLTYVFEAARQVAQSLTSYAVVVTKSTVPVGTNRLVEAIVRENIAAGLSFDVASNPEFLREGSAIEDFKRPDRVVVGAETDQARGVLKELYRPLYLNETPIVFTGLETAEVIKYAANAFLATKITFINEISDLCEKVGANVKEVAKGIGLDKRIGNKFLHAGPGYGGSCFPKDTLALRQTGRDVDSPLRIVEAVIEINEKRKQDLVHRVERAHGESLNGKKVAVLGLTFKPNTDDMRDAPSLSLLPALAKAGATICAHDPEGMTEAKKIFDSQNLPLTYARSPYEAAQEADIVVLITEWNLYRALDLDRLKATMKGNTFVDLRNVYTPSEVRDKGFVYEGIGRK